MPLFQPSNITPSTFSGVGGGTVDSSDNVKISWQVNGNVAMTGYEINIFDTQNIIVYSSGILTNGTPFYPTDENGDIQYFLYVPNTTWAEIGLIDGAEYYLQIKQYWGNETDSTHLVTQFSPSFFITRSKPIVDIALANGIKEFSEISAVEQSFIGEYSQNQDDSIEWVRWRLYSKRSETIKELIDDTGIVNTQILSYIANSLLNGGDYSISLTVQTENGIEESCEKHFSIQYNDEELKGDFLVDCTEKESNLLTCKNLIIPDGDYINGTSNKNNYSFSKDGVVIPQGTNISWSTKNDAALNISPDWSLHWKGKIDFAKNYPKEGQPIYNIKDMRILSGAVFNADGSEVTIWGGSSFCSCSVSNRAISARDTKKMKSVVNTCSYYKDGRLFVGGFFGGYFGGVYDSDKLSFDGTAYSSAFNAPYWDILAIGLTDKILFCRLRNGGIYSIAERATTVTGHIQVIFEPNGKYLLAVGEEGIEQFSRNSTTDGSFYKSDGLLLNIKSEPTEQKHIEFNKDGNYLIYNGKIFKVTYGPYTISSLQKIADLRDANVSCFANTADYIFSCSTMGHDLYIDKIKEESIVNESNEEVQNWFNSYIVCAPNDRGCLIIGGMSSIETCYYFVDQSGSTEIISAGNMSIFAKNNIQFSVGGYSKTFEIGICNELVLTLSDSYEVQFSILGNKESVKFLAQTNGEEEIGSFNAEDYPQGNITEVELNGEQTCEFLHIVKGKKDVLNTSLPSWDSETVLLTHFDKKTLQAGQGDLSSKAIDIYRKDLETEEIIKIYSLSGGEEQIKDYGWKAKKDYQYFCFGRVDLLYAAKNVFTPNLIRRNSAFYLLMETEQDARNNLLYRVIKTWRFENNIQSGSVSNNNAPAFLENFTGYRLKQPSSKKGKSGTLTALLSNVEDYSYQDTAYEMESLYALSQSENTLFLKDMKGNLYMISISGAITQTINTKSAFQEVTVSIPWEEVGPTDGISIIQTID